MASSYHKTPYDLLQDTPLAFNFNRAVYLYGSRVEQLLEEKEEIKVGPDKGKLRPKHSVEEALQLAARPASSGLTKTKGLAMLAALLNQPGTDEITV